MSSKNLTFLEMWMLFVILYKMSNRLWEAQTLSWSETALKSLVLIGDDILHPPAHNPKKIELAARS